VILWEMRPERATPAHRGGDFAELVCSNSLRSDDPHHAAGLLKREMEAFGSLVIAAARATAVPAGSALAVDRDRFAARITEVLEAEPRIEIRRRELEDFPAGDVVVATGPLTSPALTERLRELLGGEHLYFYDAIAPIVDAETLDHDRLFRASRWDKGGGDDYLNAPFDREQYLAFWRALVEAEVLAAHPCERELFFEGCLPVEELARRGEDTLRYGPMKPVGLRLPDGRRPYAVAQLRQENLARTHYNLVGFQSRLRWPEQKRVLHMVPGLEHAEFVRLGQVHRNTFVNSPIHLDARYRLKVAPRLRLAGQITGVEGYLESAATGLLCALYLALERRAEGAPPEPLPTTTALGALARHLTESDPARFQPANINYGLLLPLDEATPRRERRAALAGRATEALRQWMDRQGPGLAAEPEPFRPVLESTPALAR
jgi:methylenetetrahydrofolate--tRNA-(uracil-5-)-methyltransferase